MLAKRLAILAGFISTFSFSVVQADNIRFPDTPQFHQNYSEIDQRVTREQAPWMTLYSQATSLSKAGKHDQALDLFEQLLTDIAHREAHFGRAYVRYQTLTEQLHNAERSAQFFTELAKNADFAWVKGAAIYANVINDSQTLNREFAQRLVDNQTSFADSLLSIYKLALPLSESNEADLKAEDIYNVASKYDFELDDSGIYWLASLRYQADKNFSISLDFSSEKLINAISEGDEKSTIEEFSKYTALLVEKNNLAEGVTWFKEIKQQFSDDFYVDLLLDFIVSAEANHKLYQQATLDVQNLRETHNNSLMLVLIESYLQYQDFTGGYTQADQTLKTFAENNTYAPHIQKIIQTHRTMIGRWAGQIKSRSKRAYSYGGSLSGGMGGKNCKGGGGGLSAGGGFDTPANPIVVAGRGRSSGRGRKVATPPKPAAAKPEKSAPKKVKVSKSQHPEAAEHIQKAQNEGKPKILTIDRSNTKKNRRESLKGIPTQKGKDRDEYPPAMFEEGGKGASVKHINPRDNRGAGSCVGAQCRGLPNGTRVELEVVD